MIITLPSNSHIHHISFTFLSHVCIPSNITLDIWANSLQNSAKQLLHILILCKLFWNFEVSFKKIKIYKKKERKKEKRNKRKKKREIRRREKENKLGEYLLPPPSLPFPFIFIIHRHPHHLGAKLSQVVPPLFLKIHFVYMHICF